MSFSTPILFLVFNRPDETQLVFNELKKLKPKKIYVSADGARSNIEGEDEKCLKVIEVIKQVDWECEVKTNYQSKNSGCKIAVSNGINWFFENEEEGIILEDDCVPNQSFFKFCSTLLEYYRDHEDIMHIGGNNFQDGIVSGDGSYYFSKIPHIWGWASWRRAWKKYDITLGALESYIENPKSKKRFSSFFEWVYWTETFKRVKKENFNTWDYQWTFALMNNNGKAISPQINMITNIGFGVNATHTDNKNDKLRNLIVSDMEKIVHPTSSDINMQADLYWYKKIIPWQLKIKYLLRKFLKF